MLASTPKTNFHLKVTWTTDKWDGARDKLSETLGSWRGNRWREWKKEKEEVGRKQRETG